MGPVGRFDTELLIAPSPFRDDRWVLRGPLVYRGCRQRFTVPEGFLTDLASTPRMMWWWLPPFGKYIEAAVLHDYFYSSKIVPRHDADRMFLLAMQEAGTRLIRAAMMYYAVRWFGWIAWRKR